MSGVPDKTLSDLPHILVVDDDSRIGQLVSRYLSDNGFMVASAENPAQARTLMNTLSFDALVVDVMMPGETGLEFTASLRGAGSRLPVILLTALGETENRIAGLESGADDYLPKPFEPRELVLRLQAILRRQPKPETLPATGNLRIGRWVYNPSHSEISDGKDTVRLTTTEETLLRALAVRAGQAVSREDLARLCGAESDTRAIDVQVTRLRRKIEENPKTPRFLQTVRGLGYRLMAEVAS